jgi:PAS domain S-box-containing protein
MKEDVRDPIRRFGKIGEQVLNGIVQSIEAAVVLHDRNLEVVFVNDAFENIFEIKGEDVIGRSPMDFLPDFDAKHKEAILLNFLTTLHLENIVTYWPFPFP